MKLDPRDTWIYYQALVTLGTLTIAVSNVFFAYAAYKFFKKARHLIHDIERNTRVVKVDVLRRVALNAKSRAEGNRINHQILQDENRD